MSIDPGVTLGVIRERRPLVHNITNYVVMNETANAILALGALPVMAHAKDEVREMVGLAGALVLNIGTLSEDWVEAMLLAGAEANARGIPIVLDPVGAGATAYRTNSAKRILRSFAATPASSIASIQSSESVPMLSTSAPASLTISRTSPLACAITGSAPSARIAFAVSFITT